MSSIENRPNRSCRQCSNTFKATHHLQEYCSVECNRERKRLRAIHDRKVHKESQSLEVSREYIKDEDIVVPAKFLVRGTPGPGKIRLEGVNFGSTS